MQTAHVHHQHTANFSTCALCQNWRHWFCTLLCVKLAHFFFLCCYYYQQCQYIASLQDGRPHIHSHHVYCYDSSLVYLYTIEKLYSYYRMHNITILFHWYQRSSPSTMSQLYMQLSSHTVNVPLWSLNCLGQHCY